MWGVPSVLHVTGVLPVFDMRMFAYGEGVHKGRNQAGTINYGR